jgi:hypothetical protein
MLQQSSNTKDMQHDKLQKDVRQKRKAAAEVIA